MMLYRFVMLARTAGSEPTTYGLEAGNVPRTTMLEIERWLPDAVASDGSLHHHVPACTLTTPVVTLLD
jgi:hypothetical protein